jgi:hypothetical protein
LAFNDEQLRQLLAQDASTVDAPDRAGRTAYIVACQMDNAEAVAALVEAGCAVDFCYAAAESGPLTGWEWVEAEQHTETGVVLRRAAHDTHEGLRAEWLATKGHTASGTEEKGLAELAKEVSVDRAREEFHESQKIRRAALRTRLQRERSGKRPSPGDWIRLSAKGIQRMYAEGRGPLMPADLVQALATNNVGGDGGHEGDVRVRVMTKQFRPYWYTWQMLEFVPAELVPEFSDDQLKLQTTSSSARMTGLKKRMQVALAIGGEIMKR